MGQDINHSHFKKSDFLNYENHLKNEFQLLASWFEAQQETPPTSLAQESLKAGFELEAILIDSEHRPNGINEHFIQSINLPAITAELANFNIEINSSVRPIQQHVFSDFEQELNRIWQACKQHANSEGYDAMLIGTLPTMRNTDLSLQNMSKSLRYQAINEQILRMRKGQAIELNIQGSDTLKSIHTDVMLEAATTSFQLHLQLPFQHSVRYFNSAIVISAPMVALGANSPFLFGKDLWAETRIPTFEQAVPVGGFNGAVFGPIKRAGFGQGYIQQSLLECFRENIEHYPVLLAEQIEDDPEKLKHLTLHNGTVWRWNRPLVGIDAHNNYSLRLEHRVLPAGPTIVDCIANAAFFYGLLESMAKQYTIAEEQLPFVQARENFYLAAKFGLKSKITWLNGKPRNVQKLLLHELLPMARDGLSHLNVARDDIDYYLGIIQARLENGQNGCAWQRKFLMQHDGNSQQMIQNYIDNQNSGQAVHLWNR